MTLLLVLNVPNNIFNLMDFTNVYMVIGFMACFLWLFNVFQGPEGSIGERGPRGLQVSMNLCVLT